MSSWPIPEDEVQRIEALNRYGVLDTGAEQVYDDLTLLAAKVLDAPVAALTFVDRDSVFYKSSYGARLAREPRSESICAHTVVNPLEATVVEDTQSDPRFEHSLIVRSAPQVRAYAGAPILTPDFYAIGSLCVMDDKPRRFTIDQMELLRTLARQVVSQLELRRQAVLLSSANDKLRTLASCDGLTGLKNHRAFQDRLDDEMDYAHRSRTSLSLLLIDVDHFKDYNDRFGHPAGDEVLQAVSILLIESSREYDYVARYGGEEFAIILRGADAAEAFAVAERLRLQIAGANWPLRAITASIGVATYSQQLNSREALIGEADRLLYEAKESGRNCVRGSILDELLDPAQWIAAMSSSESLVTSKT